MLEKIVAEFHPRKDLDYSYYLRFEQFPQTTGVVEYFSFLGKELAGVAYTFARPLVRGSTLGATAGAVGTAVTGDTSLTLLGALAGFSVDLLQLEGHIAYNIGRNVYQNVRAYRAKKKSSAIANPST